MDYFIAQGSENLGPFTIDQLRERGITPYTEVWADGMPEWMPAGKVPELQGLFPGMDASVLFKDEGEDDESLGSSFLPALGHALYTIIYFLFVTPFDLWRKAIIRLAKQKREGSLRIMSINTEWPFLSLLKRFLFEFLFDFLIFMSYIIGPIFVLISIANGRSETILPLLIGVYFLPLGFSIIRDILQVLLLPLRKLISWFRKPAQYLDLKVK